MLGRRRAEFRELEICSEKEDESAGYNIFLFKESATPQNKLK